VLKVKRLVAECFVEATKTALEQLGTYRLSLQHEGTIGPPDLTRTYGEVRRLRDYLQRCTCVRQDEIEVDMSAADQRLLVACCRRSVDFIEFTLSGPRVLGADEAIELGKKREVVGHWALELATYPLLELPLSQLSAGQTQASRALHARLQQKVKAEKREQEREQEREQQREQEREQERVSERTRVPENEAMSQATLAEPIGMAIEDLVIQSPRDVATPEPESVSTSLLDTKKLRDARLRAMVASFLASYECCLATGDYRLAEVLLSSVVEAALLDHVLPRRNELGLKSSPETWSPQGLLIQLMGDQLSSRDHAMVNRMMSARSLLRPAMQLVMPTIISFEDYESLCAFVKWVLAKLGYSMD
jgi:hypothetical protein